MKATFLLAPAITIALAFSTGVFCAEGVPSELSRYTVRMVKVDVAVLAERVGSATGKTFVIDPHVKDLVTLETKGPVSADELYSVFVRVLSDQGLRLTERRNGSILIAPSNVPPPATHTDPRGFISI